MNFLQFIIGRQLAINQGVTTQQATTDGLITMIMKQPMGLVFALFMAKNQAANEPQVNLLAPSTTTLTPNPTVDAIGSHSPVTFVAAVTRSAPAAGLVRPALAAPAPAIPTGMIVFSELTSGAPVVIGSVPLDATGTATLYNVPVSVGAHTYVAIYMGDLKYQRSSSPSSAPITLV
jgi:hypothetical protein